jgi:hypothetical protein
MKSILIILILFSLSYSKDFYNRFDSLRYSTQNARKPQGFLISPIKLMPLIPIAPKDSTKLSDYNIIVRGTVSSSLSRLSNTYVTLKEHGQDIQTLKSQLDSLKNNQEKLLEIATIQQKNSDDLTDSQSFTLKLIETLTGLLGAIATVASILYKKKKG